MDPASPAVAEVAGDLRFDGRYAVGTLELEVTLDVPAGTVVAVVGPNGAGKTTLLRLLAGLVGLDGGAIHFGDDTWDDPASGTFLLSEQRRTGMVFQDHLLLPHLDARANVAFGLRSRGMARAEANARADAALARVGLADHATERPRALSGGQAQRVALARALAADPAVLLLDEPLAALDARTRVEVRRDLRRQLDEFPGPAVLVTHDPVDALTLADAVVVLEQGRITQSGSIAEVTGRPRSRYVADLLGVNLLRGTADGATVQLDSGARVVIAEPAPPSAEGGQLHVLVPPSAVMLSTVRPEGTSARNVWAMRIERLDPVAGRVRAGLVGEGDAPRSLVAELTPAAVATLGLREGREVWAAVKATELDVYPD
jgi:molybdate transport system ATP-binding protein